MPVMTNDAMTRMVMTGRRMQSSDKFISGLRAG